MHAPTGDPGDWTARQHLYIGEFIRRHHARMAHEIALCGVPGDLDERREVLAHAYEELAEHIEFWERQPCR